MPLFRSTLLATIAVASSALAATDVDAFLASRRSLPVPGPLSAQTARRVANGRISGVEPRLGVPTFFWAERGENPIDLRALGVTPTQAARRALVDYAELWRTTPASLLEAPLVGLHDLGTGAVIAQFGHRVGGLPVFQERLNVAMTQRLEVVAVSGTLSALPWKEKGFKLSAPTALSVAFEGGFGQPVDGARFVPAGVDEAGALRFDASGLESHRVGLARAMQVLYPDVDSGQLVSAWYVELDASLRTSTAAELIGTVVSALDGRVLWRHSLTEREGYIYRVWADPATKLPLDGPNGRATPHPTGLVDGSTFPFVLPRLVTLENAGLSTNDPWLPPAAAQTTGNNVDAYADLAAPDGFGPGDIRGLPTQPGVFDDRYDVTLAPGALPSQYNAGITQLFYTVNWLHDWFYDRGFNELAGNAQTSNFTRGGAGGDPILAEAQDSSGLNNANMSTPADGANPRMQMFVWQPPAAARVQAPSASFDAPGVTAVFGPTSFDITAPAVIGADGTAPTGDGCQPLVGTYTGKIVVIDRGTCSFKTKIANAQLAGAAGVVLANSAAAPPGALADDATITTPITIGAELILQAAGTTLKAAINAGPVAVRIYRITPPNRDGSVDNTVVAHEWGHYLAHRLIPGLGNLQSRGMGEGWSDFVALLMTTEAADAALPANPTFGGVYALAVWDTDSTALPTNAPYFGIRRIPYSVDFTKNAFTFKHIADGVALPSGPPILAFGPNSEVHNTGEVWAAMLWEGYVALLRDTPRLTFPQAQDRMIRTLVAGMKLTPANPTFTEARDGVLAAAAASDLADFRLLAQAFARRGAGILSVAPGRDAPGNSPVVEDFTTGREVAFVSATLDDEGFYCDRDGLLDVGEKGRLKITLKNTGYDTLNGLTGTLTSALTGVTLTPSTLSFPAIEPFTTATVEAEVTLPSTGLTTPTALQLDLSFTATNLARPGPRTQTLSFVVQKDSVANQNANDDFEADILAWSLTADAGSPSSNFERQAQSGLAHTVFGIDPDEVADYRLESPPLQVGTAPFSFTFRNRWAFEKDGTTAYDGAVLELSTDNGVTWVDIGASATPGYTDTLDNTSGNPLGGRQGWSGRNAGYPAFVTTTVTLGTTYSGQAIKVRLRVASDQASGDVGWEVDDFVFTGITNTPFPKAVADRAQCINRPPVANAGPDLTVDERSMVTLSSAGSTDPDNNTLTATWTQLSGIPVTVTNGVFAAPEVTIDETLRFSLRVNDGTSNSLNTDEVQVKVRQVNRKPVVSAGADQAVDERASFVLPGTATDADGQALTLLWTQKSGPTATLTGANTGTLLGLAPEVTAETPLTFELSASDGTDTTTDTVTLTVRQVNRPPTATASTPEATVAIGATVSLVGTAVDADGDATTVVWSQTGGPSVDLTTPTALNAGFTAPLTADNATLTFKLVANDGQVDSAPATVSVVVTGNGKRLTAVPGSDVTVASGATVQLDGSASSDPAGGALTFKWTQENGGSALSFDDATRSKPTLTAPTVTSTERLTVRLTVKNAAGATASAIVRVTVEPKAAGCGCTGFGGAEPLLLAAGLMLLRRRKQ